MKYLLNCRSFIFLVVLFPFINNFGMEIEKDEQFFEGISIKRLENGDDIAPDEIYFYKSFAFIGIYFCVAIFQKLFYPNTGNINEPHKDIYYSIGEKKIHLRFKFFWGNGFLSDLVTSQKLNYNYFFLCFYTCVCNEEECINRRSSIYQFLNAAGINEILNNDNFYFVADTMPLKNGGGNIIQSNFSEKNFKNLEKYGNVLITNTGSEEKFLCKTDEEKEIHLNEENVNTVEGCWLKIVLRDLNKKMKEEKEKIEIENLQKEKSDNENKKVEGNSKENDEENEENCCECICTFIKNCF